MISRAEAAQTLLERSKATASYPAWCRHAAAKRGWKLARHHLLIATAIDDVLMEKGPSRLLIIAPPGSAKSTYGTQMVPGYFFHKYPNGQMISGSHTQEKADEFSLAAQGFIRDNRRELDFDVGGRFSREAASAWGTDKGAGYRAIGVGKKIAGLRADLVFLDDPVGHSEEVNSLDKRDKIWRWFWNDLRTRLRPGGRIVLIMTRWHEDDIAGRLLRNARVDEWRVVHVSAEAENQDILGRKPGEMLWESEYGYGEELRRIKAEFEANGRMAEWQALYQGRPTTPNGALFQIRKLGVLETEPAGYQWVRAWDLAASSNRGDFTVGLKLGIGADRRLCIGDIQRLRGDPAEVERVIAATAAHDGVGTRISLPQDPGQAGAAQILYLTRSLLGFSVKATRESGDKLTRAMPAAAQVNAGNVWMVASTQWNDAFVDELTTFPKGIYDDQVDALSRAIIELVAETKPTHRIQFSFMER